MVRAMAEHTPGPWEMYITPYGITIASGSAGWAVTTIPPSGPRDNPTHESNARLIAAAPDLLAALRELLACEHFVQLKTGEPAGRALALSEAFSHGRDVVAKATGMQRVLTASPSDYRERVRREAFEEAAKVAKAYAAEQRATQAEPDEGISIDSLAGGEAAGTIIASAIRALGDSKCPHGVPDWRHCSTCNSL